MWNSFELECPASDLVPYPPPDRYIRENLRDFVTFLTTAADSLTFEDPLWDEIKVLNNIQAKYKRILRCDRILTVLQRVGHCLRKMVLLNLSKSYLDLAERFLIGFQGLNGTPLLPSRQQVEYVLIRTLSASRLVSQAITHSRKSFCHLIQKLKVGHLILDLIMATSVIARMNILLRAILVHLSTIYKQALFWRHKVKKGSYQWGREPDFPQDLEEWIENSDPNFLQPLSMSEEDMGRVKVMLQELNVTKNQKEVESIVLDSDDPEDSPTLDFLVNTDFGEVIGERIDKTSQESSKKKSTKTNQKLEKWKKVESSDNELTKLQKALLQKILMVQSAEQLEDLYWKTCSSCQECFIDQKVLSRRKKDKVSKVFAEIKDTHPPEMFTKIYKTKPQFLKIAILRVCKTLGFTKDHIRMCKRESDSKPDSSDEIEVLDASKPLVPVKTLKDLKLLYVQLQEILSVKKETAKLKLLKSNFKQRISDIKHLKEKGERGLAKKLTLCTSKEFLALYQ